MILVIEFKSTASNPHFTISATGLRMVRRFTYLRCTITSDAKITMEVDRLAKVNSSFNRLYKRVGYNRHLKKDTKISVNRTIAFAIFLYGLES